MKKATGVNFIGLAILAFVALGLEVVLALGIEPVIFGALMNEWSDTQNIIHWVVTCLLWGCASWGIIQLGKKKYGFNLFKKGKSVRIWQWLIIAIFVIISLIISYFDWNDIKVIKEFYANGLIKFVFQYIYYIFETVLVMLILIFGQVAFERWFNKENIPYGGIVVAITWGMAHFFIKDFGTGITCMFSGFAFGSVYLLTNRDIRITFPILWIMFVL